MVLPATGRGKPYNEHFCFNNGQFCFSVTHHPVKRANFRVAHGHRYMNDDHFTIRTLYSI